MSIDVTALRVDGSECDGFSFETGEATAGRRTDVTLRATSRNAAEAGIRVELRLPPAEDPRWLVPGAFYGENRPAESKQRFPRFVPGRADLEAMESSAWSFRADRCATPAVCSGDTALVTTERSELGQSGVGLAYEDGQPILRLHFPYREEPLTYDGSQAPAPPDVRVHSWAPGETATLRFSIHRASPPGDVVRDVYARGGRATDAAWMGVAEAAELAAWGLYRWHFREDPGRLIEAAPFDRSLAAEDRDAMHVSWVSGAPYAYALLRHGRRVGNDDYVRAAESVLDHIAASSTPGGTFWSQWTAERGWTTGWHPDRQRLHARTLADAALFMLRAGEAWAEAARSTVAVAVRTQRDDGALPAAHHVETGEAVSWDGTAGLAWIPALVEAGYLDEARSAGAYYERFEHYRGAPEDVDLASTSEDGYGALMAYVALEDWANARRAADWMLTFRYSYDVAFDPATTLGRHGFRSRGADNASPANPHLHAFGLICHAELKRLAEATGDEHYAERAREHFDCFRQFIAREDGDFGAQRGMVTERYFQTGAFGEKGSLLPLSHAWSIGVLLLACEDELG